MIAIDLGNTSLHFAYFKGKRIVKTLRFPTSEVNQKTLKKLFSSYKEERIVVCSVVPEITKLFEKLNRKVAIVGKDVKVPIESFYNKKNIGMDRLVGAYAAKKFFPRTRLILDFGTAITLDFLSNKGDYLGGLILPGIGATLKVLSKCALLPDQITFKKTKKIIPRNTQESITKGLAQGISSMVNGLVKKYQKILNIPSDIPTIVTGGEASLVKSRLKFKYTYQKDLVLRGLFILTEGA